ncbi:MAG TPA: ABC transporter permease [Longimicrobiaceae bacterium]|jgi:putative ABC transport system permease protein|nr:ABC transporter permease [Longimicrobiaceae bacterium]
MNLTSAREGVGIALDALRSNKVRAFLTILGIVIGVATVMAMAAVVGGLRTGIMQEIEGIGPNNFVVTRFEQGGLLISDGTGRPPWEGKPPVTFQEAELIRSLPSIRSAAAAVDAGADLKYGASTYAQVMLPARDHQWPDYAQGDFVFGRNFLPDDVARSNRVVVLSIDLAKKVFGEIDPVGKSVRLRGEPFQVVGVYRQKPNFFSNFVKEWGIVPPTTAIKYLDADKDFMSLLVVPAGTVSQEQAIDDVTAALRVSRGLRPGEENNFAVTRQQAIADMFDRITGVFALIMLVLSSIGLMVGGIGVVAIMMISVTERTREIGVRKALGATRREILWQFLVESMTVTTIGGAIGMVLGGGGALLLAAFTPLPAVVPLWSVAAALAVSAVTGIGFGLYPANKAARMDPVEALRHE